MKLIIEMAQEDINPTTLSLIERLFKATGPTTEKSTNTDSNTKTTDKRNCNTIMSDPYSLEDILPEVISPKQTPTNVERLKEFASSIENTLGEKDKKALDKFVNFYLPKINDWKQDISIQNLWDRWINSERK